MGFIPKVVRMVRIRLFWALVCMVLSSNLSVHAQNQQTRTQISMGSLFGLLRQDVLTSEAVTPIGQAIHAPYSAPWFVVQDSVDKQLANYKQAKSNVDGLSALEGPALFEPFDTPQKVSVFISSLRTMAVKITARRLIASGVPPDIAAAISERMPRKYLFDLQKALLSYTELPHVTRTTFAKAINEALRQSSKTVLKPTVDYKSVATAIRAKLRDNKIATMRSHYVEVGFGQEALPGKNDLNTLFDQATKPPDLTNIREIIGKCLTPGAVEKLQMLEQTDPQAAKYVLEGITGNLLATASERTASLAVPRALSLDNAFEVLTKVSQFREVERDTAVHIRQGAENLTTGLDAARNIMDSNWNSLRAQATHIEFKENFSPAYIPQIGSTIHIVNDLSVLTSGGTLDATSLTELSGLAAANIPGADGLLKLAPSLSTLTDAQATFAQKGGALLGGLATLTGSEQLKQVTSAFNTVSNIMQTAGPLLSLAGFATPFGGVALIGGLMAGGGPFGGGGGDAATAAALAAISKKLEEIDHKLDTVIDKLDKLDRKISAEHAEVMNALESISFDINRTLTGVNIAQVEEYSSHCVQIEKMFQGTNAPEGALAENYKSYFVDCQADLTKLNDGPTKGFVKAIANLPTVDLQNTARHKLDLIVAQHSKSQQSSVNNCFSLILASYSVHELISYGGRGILAAESDPQKSLCNDVLSVGDMLDPGLLSLFSRLEWSSAFYSTTLSQSSAVSLMWKDDAREKVERRWAGELRVLNAAIGQQSLLLGDVTLPNWANMLNLQQPLDSTDREVLDNNALLARNSLRYWTQNHVETTRVTEPESQPGNDSGPGTPEQPTGIGQDIQRRQWGATRRSDEFTSALQYAASYYGCSPNYLQSLVERGTYNYEIVATDFHKTHFKWTDNVQDRTTDPKALVIDDEKGLPRPCSTRKGSLKRWCVLFEGLNNCIDLPTPDEMTSGELLRGDNLEALLNARDQVLTLLETTDLISSYEDRLGLVAALAIQWRMLEKTREQGERSKKTRVAQSSAVSEPPQRRETQKNVPSSAPCLQKHRCFERRIG
jgi:hypothetical protein